MTEFNSFGKIARWSRRVIITEKIDGTNASIFIGEDGEFLVGSRDVVLRRLGLFRRRRGVQESEHHYQDHRGGAAPLENLPEHVLTSRWSAVRGCGYRTGPVSFHCRRRAAAGWRACWLPIPTLRTPG